MTDLATALRQIAMAQPANEAEVETKVLLHVFRLLGYTDVDRADKPTIYMAFGRQRKPTRPDFILYDGAERSLSNALVAVETKPPGEDLVDATEQVKSYALWAGTPFYIACNGTHLRVAQFAVGLEEPHSTDIELGAIETDWARLSALISRGEAILAKERIAYFIYYLPQVENLPPHEFFEVYLERTRERFSMIASPEVEALRPPQENQIVIPRIPVTTSIESGGEARDHSEAEVLEFVTQPTTRLLIVGAAGSGKSTLARRIAARSALLALSERQETLPIYLRLANSVPATVMEAFTAACSELSLRVLPNLFRQKLENSQPLLLLDGLDEIELSEVNFAKLRALMREAEKASLIITSRPEGESAFESLAQEFDVTHGRVRDLTETEVNKIFLDYLGSEARAHEVLEAIPDGLRKHIRSPLFALMTIRVAKASPNWVGLNRYQLYEKYIAVLDEFFNAATVRGHTASVETAVVVVLAAVAAAATNKPNPSEWSLADAEQALEPYGGRDSLVRLLNTGLASSIGGTLRFAHQSFLDFGVARYILGCIRSFDHNAFLRARISIAAGALLAAELKAADERTLVNWLTRDWSEGELQNRFRRRILTIFRNGCGAETAKALRPLLDQDLPSRIWRMAVHALAAHGGAHKLPELAPYINGKENSRRAKAVARALVTSGRDEYDETVREMAQRKWHASFLVSYARSVLRSQREKEVKQIAAIYQKRGRGQRFSFIETVDWTNESPTLRALVEGILTHETEPLHVLFILNQARPLMPRLGHDAIAHAVSIVATVKKPKELERRFARRIHHAISGPRGSPQRELHDLAAALGA